LYVRNRRLPTLFLVPTRTHTHIHHSGNILLRRRRQRRHTTSSTDINVNANTGPSGLEFDVGDVALADLGLASAWTPLRAALDMRAIGGLLVFVLFSVDGVCQAGFRPGLSFEFRSSCSLLDHATLSKHTRMHAQPSSSSRRAGTGRGVGIKAARGKATARLPGPSPGRPRASRPSKRASD
jgi:hypothetical protein